MAINKKYISVAGPYSNSLYEWYDVPSNPKIKINSPTVSMPSDWEIGRIAVSDNGQLEAGSVNEQILYGPLYD